MSRRRAVALVAALLPVGATPAAGQERPVEAVSLLGDTLRRPRVTDAVRERYEAALATARAAYEQAPEDLDSIIWLGRRTAYLGRYRDALRIYSRGLTIHPDAPRLLRHRGHRYLSTRQLDRAVADFRRAAALVAGTPDRVEADGLPNARGIPTSTLQSNIWYHLGLAHYVRGAFGEAAAAYRNGLAVSTSPDMVTAMSYWHWLTLRRLGEDRAAARVLGAVDPDVDIIENTAYHRLLMLFAGRVPADSLLPAGDTLSLQDVTTAYGVGAWHLVEGRRAEAMRIFRRILAARDQWPAFGYLAAEAEVARTRSDP